MSSIFRSISDTPRVPNPSSPSAPMTQPMIGLDGKPVLDANGNPVMTTMVMGRDYFPLAPAPTSPSPGFPQSYSPGAPAGGGGSSYVPPTGGTTVGSFFSNIGETFGQRKEGGGAQLYGIAVVAGAALLLLFFIFRRKGRR